MNQPEQGSSEGTNWNLPDYRTYRLNGTENFFYYSVASAALGALGFLFYRSLLLSLLCASASLLFRKTYENFLCDRRKERLLEGFRDALYIIAGSTAAGRQMPQAFEDALEQCLVIYGSESDICFELNNICSQYRDSHVELESLLMDFGKRSTLPEIIQFASSYEICRKNGGDAENVCMKSADLLLDKIEFRKEAKAMISEKKLDIVLLTLMPIGMVLLLNLYSFSYLEPLYGNAEGRVIMTLCLAGIAASLKMGIKITNINV